MIPICGKRLSELTSNVKEPPSRLRIWLCQYGDDRAIVKPRERLNHRRAKERQRFDCLRSPARARIVISCKLKTKGSFRDGVRTTERKRVVYGKRGSVRVYIGGDRMIKNTKRLT